MKPVRLAVCVRNRPAFWAQVHRPFHVQSPNPLSPVGSDPLQQAPLKRLGVKLRERHRQTDRQRDRERETERDREIERQRGRQKDRQADRQTEKEADRDKETSR